MSKSVYELDVQEGSLLDKVKKLFEEDGVQAISFMSTHYEELMAEYNALINK